MFAWGSLAESVAGECLLNLEASEVALAEDANLRSWVAADPFGVEYVLVSFSKINHPVAGQPLSLHLTPTGRCVRVRSVVADADDLPRVSLEITCRISSCCVFISGRYHSD